MIEEVIKKFLDGQLDVPSFFEHQSNLPDAYIIIERIGGKNRDGLKSSVFAFQSYASSLFEAAKLNEKLKGAVGKLVDLDQVAGVHLNSDYNYTDTETKRYRYQAVFDINHY